MTTMRGWRVATPGPVHASPMVLGNESVPHAASSELLVRVLACGVCRTDLHVVEGDLPVHRPHVRPGHEIVGEVIELGEDVAAPFHVGQRVGIPWLRRTCGTCRFCVRGDENLCTDALFTGWDRDGGYAEFTTVPADFALTLPAGYTDSELAPLLCAGIIGYRALERAALPPGGRLGVYGFGGSAHLATQVAIARGATVHVMTRGEQSRSLATSLGAASTQGPTDMPPEPLDSAILFAPVGDLVPTALEALDGGGTLSVAGIHLTDIPQLNYQRHLFRERQLRSVTANTRADAREFLEFTGRHHMRITVHPYPLDAADLALRDLSDGRFDGAAVLIP